MTSAPLSLQLYSVRDAIAADLPSALQQVAATGLRNVELYDFVGRSDEYAELLPQHGLRAPSAHAHLLGEDSAAIFAAAGRLGIATVIDPHIDESRWTTREDVEAIADELSALVAPATDAGLTIGYHNHWFEFADLDGVTAFEVFADRLAPEVVLEVDTYWAQVGGTDAAALLGRLGSRVRFLHVKDGPATRDTAEQLPAGQGTIDIPAVLAAAPDALRVIEFDDYSGNVFDGVRQSIRYLTGRGESL